MVRRAAESYLACFEGLPRSVWLLAGVLLINRCGTMVVPFLTIYLTQQRGFDAVSVGWLLSACGLGGVLGAYWGGWLTKQFGPLPVVVGTLALAAPTYAVIPHCEGTLALFAALFTQQLVGAATRPATSTATTLFAPAEQHPQALALNRLAVNLGCSVGPVVGGALAEIDFYWIFPANAAGTLAAAIAAAAFFAGSRTNTLPPEPTAAPASTTSSPWRDGPFLGFLALFTLGEVVFYQVLVTLPLYWREHCGFGELAIGLLFAVNTVLIVFCEMPLTRCVQRFRPLAVVGVGAVCSGVGFGLTPCGESFLAASLLVVVWTVGEMLAAPFSATYAASRSSESQRGPYMAAYAMSLSVASVIAPIVGMTLYRWNPVAPWWCALGLTGLLAAGFLTLARGESARARSAVAV